MLNLHVHVLGVVVQGVQGLAASIAKSVLLPDSKLSMGLRRYQHQVVDYISFSDPKQ